MIPKPHILVVDDEADVREVIQLNLAREGYDVVSVADGMAALEQLRAQPFDAAIVDVMMPGMDGLALCRAIRQDAGLRRLPLLLLTARDSELDQIVGLEVGADDFISKSASPRLIATRLKAALRRFDQQAEGNQPLAFGDLTIDRDRREVRGLEGSLTLTALEYALLLALAENPSRVFTRSNLLTLVWGDDVVVTERTVDVHIKNLRQKIGANGELIETVHGVGYRVKRVD
ncbi:MAG: response regulator transcription factor [Candidatus Marinimicrobia bacterium]|nr:response regulator transcription factor [Candidatus Neomarinimicrobiota bacterium]